MSDSFSSFGFCCHPYSNGLGNHSELLLGTECAADHTLRLDSPYHHVSKCSSIIGIKRKWCECSGAVRDPGNLALGLGHSLLLLHQQGSSGTTCTATSARAATDEETSIGLALDVQLHLGHSNILGSTVYSMDAPLTTEVKPNLDIQLSLYTGLSESVSSITAAPFPQKNSIDMDSVKTPDDDGSASSSNWKLQSNSLPSLKASEITWRTANHKLSRFSHIQIVPELSPTTVTMTKSSVTCTSGCVQPQQRTTSNKTCQFQGCTKRSQRGFWTMYCPRWGKEVSESWLS
ncbi:hypothetical protein HPP92_006182 [Vanilla planifolia]|uniref:Uncharacterized protein n=1 Tax=Vanilla planifolia TaxID=51239 RepID=A0A835VFF0_VANPL|nr:hypothetical protein HPP92_006182 [Vanilla planifolia]